MLLDRILSSVERNPAAIAVASPGQPITYRQLRALIGRTVIHLRANGIEAGDVVALSLGQTPLYIIVFLALGWIGALSVPIPVALRRPDRDELLRKHGIRAVITERLEVLPPGCRLVQLTGAGARGDETMDDAGPPAYRPDTPLRLALTTGTTGLPKGVLQTHAGFEERMDRMHCDVVDEPRVLAPALHITISINLALHALCKGGSVVFPRSFGNVDFFDAIVRHGVTHVTLPPANINLMLPALPAQGPAFPGVKHLRLVGSTPTRAVLYEAQRRFSPHVYVPYGLGEVGLVSMATPDMVRDDPASVGVLEPGVRLELDGDGEVRVRIPGMPTDYFGADSGLNTRFRDGWFHPGDRARMSAEGKLYIEGRVDHIINTGGRKVAPEYVESILMEFAGVRDAAVYAVEDGAGNTLLGASIVGKVALDALKAFARQRLHVMAPSVYREVESLPRNAMGKLDRSAVPVTPAEAGVAESPPRTA
ncbi:MAG TPA: class I adenylate-forming enzyme family protein [Usitatibacter sp.]|nr:class I adenylate-forming enzyme family protein [Usitatibacter sp.]